MSKLIEVLNYLMSLTTTDGTVIKLYKGGSYKSIVLHNDTN